MKKYGDRFRFMAIAKACGDSSLFNRLHPHQGLLNFTEKKVVKLGESDDKLSAYITNLGKNSVYLAVETDDDIYSYWMGYSEAVAKYQAQDKGFCASSLQQAKKLLGKNE